MIAAGINGTVAVLYARGDSVYKTIDGCDVWDIERDARAWCGGAPVVAHPPCRAWGRLRRARIDGARGSCRQLVGAVQ